MKLKLVILMNLFISSISFGAHNSKAIYATSHIKLFKTKKELIAEVNRQGETVIRERLERAWRKTVETYKTVVSENKFTPGFLARNKRFKRSLSMMDMAVLKWGMHLPKWKMCTGQSLAYVVQAPGLRNKIFICPKAYVQNVDILQQIFIHEAAHMGGVTNECQASKMEALAIHYSDMNQALKSGYWESCELERFLDRLSQ